MTNLSKTAVRSLRLRAIYVLTELRSAKSFWYLHTTTITVPIANHDNNQHAENENIRLGNLFDGIETMGALMLIK